MRLSDDAKRQSSAIQQNAATRIEQIRARTDLSPAGKRANIARIHLETKQRVGALQEQVTSQAKAAIKSQTATAFGVNGLIPAGATSTAIATTIQSYRCAQDRADAITDPTEARRLMARAEQSGDEPLARALAARAFSERGPLAAPAWDDVLGAYLEPRPKIDQAVRELLDSGGSGLSFLDHAYFSVVTPREVERLSDNQLEALAADAPAPPQAEAGIYERRAAEYGPAAGNPSQYDFSA